MLDKEFDIVPFLSQLLRFFFWGRKCVLHSNQNEVALDKYQIDKRLEEFAQKVEKRSWRAFSLLAFLYFLALFWYALQLPFSTEC